MSATNNNNHHGNGVAGIQLPSMPGLPGKLRNIVHNPKPDISIHLDSRRKIYSTMDRIQGTVVITPAVDTEFDDVEIEFIGTSKTHVDRNTTAAAISGRSEAYHTFLRLSQPHLDRLYPDDRADRTLKAGKTYEFGFFFRVPKTLLDRVCKHKVNNDMVRDLHLQLPPSLGDQELNSKDGTLDDMTPEMASIRYGVFARITKLGGGGDPEKRTHVASKARRIRVVPAFDETPPLDVKGMIEDNVKTEYVLRKERKLKKGLLMGPLGTLVMEAAQPKSAQLPPANAELGHSRVETSATIMLRFEPAKGVKQPPRLDRLTSKLKTRTYYSTSARHDVPKKADGEFDASKGMHGCNMELASRAVGKFDWRLEEADAASQPSSRRDSTASIEEKRWIPAPSSTYTPGSAFFTAKMVVPIELPNTKHSFVPTFHSCLISRTYTIALSLSLQTAGLGGSVDLRIPMQVSAAPPIDYEEDGVRRRESVSSAVMNTDVEDDISSFFAPRSLANPAAGPAPASEGTASPPYARNRSLERSDTLDAPPPGYTDRETSRAVRTTMQPESTIIPTLSVR
ncbi:hypothetical protein WHR41_01752 [Cladosporium halotolerans]|uniref:Uncharacterized protein n=1 Tax=Cladosporium halotolerans TaxID=1052096 RepID=A0AB34L006_9PEZI